MQHDNLLEQAALVVTDEPVLGAGVFQPAKAAKNDVLSLHSSTIVGFTKPLDFDGLPQWCLLAVTATKLYILEVKTLGGKNLNVTVVREPRLFAVIDRDHLEVSFHLRKLFPSTLLLHDLERDTHYHLVGSDQTLAFGNASKVFEALQEQATEAPTADEA